MNNLGYRTDCIFHRAVGEVYKDTGGYWVVKNADNPTYRWGNLLIYPDAPKKADLQRWLRDFRKQFGDKMQHITVGWESDMIGEVEPFQQLGFEFETVVVLSRKESHIQQELPFLDPDYQIREIKTEQEWQSVVELQYRVAAEATEDLDGYFEFLEKKYEQYRMLQSRGIGTWYGVFDGAQLAADMGVFWIESEGLARFQNVETAKAYRRRGACTALLEYVIRDIYQRLGIRHWVIVTNSGSGAEQLYYKQGFKRVSLQQGVCLSRPFNYDGYFDLMEE